MLGNLFAFNERDLPLAGLPVAAAPAKISRLAENSFGLHEFHAVHALQGLARFQRMQMEGGDTSKWGRGPWRIHTMAMCTSLPSAQVLLSSHGAPKLSGIAACSRQLQNYNAPM